MKRFVTIGSVFLGNTISALGIGGFLIPAGMMMGGATGIGLAVNHYTGLPVSAALAVLNVVLFVVGAAVLGKAFALMTIISTFYSPFILEMVQQLIPEPLTQDIMLATIIGGLLVGLGMGMVLRVGASTGGMDIPPLLLKKKAGIPVGVSMYAFDFAILAVQATFAGLERMLYSVILIIIYTVVIDKIMTLGTSQIQAKIISERYEEINRAIQQRLDRGTTLIAMKGGYLGRESYEIMIVLGTRELPRLSELVTEYDPKAFMVVNKVSEVRGRGFTLGKRFLDKGITD
ncbi:MAG TPA: YitT family protein [Candidatus Lachnoclostridium stercoripullorum]|uniref:YitT family protein n=1 Tax=Candidatus Lachnoclostridium stercoripullorum TaxID=2838635 RepID=A0A9D1W2C2_9FIRM|nr:YitT family protein [Candidatus Lachnoclostridium stercoripullorum]